MQADAGANLPDYSAKERNFQLLTQVIGRVGRGHLEKAEVVIQSFNAKENELLNYVINGDYEKTARYLLNLRKKTHFPPYSFLAKLEITLKTESLVLKKIRNAAKKLQQIPTLTVSPPMPAFHERTNQGYTWQIIVRAKNRKILTDNLKNLDPNFKITLDPPSLL